MGRPQNAMQQLADNMCLENSDTPPLQLRTVVPDFFGPLVVYKHSTSCRSQASNLRNRRNLWIVSFQRLRRVIPNPRISVSPAFAPHRDYQKEISHVGRIATPLRLNS